MYFLTQGVRMLSLKKLTLGLNSRKFNLFFLRPTFATSNSQREEKWKIFLPHRNTLTRHVIKIKWKKLIKLITEKNDNLRYE